MCVCVCVCVCVGGGEGVHERENKCKHNKCVHVWVCVHVCVRASMRAYVCGTHIIAVRTVTKTFSFP